MDRSQTEQFIVPRSLLFVPGDSERKMVKAVAAGADAIIFDLEDAVAAERLPFARQAVRSFLDAQRANRTCQHWVRINSLTTGASLEDLAAVIGGGPDAILLPKVSSGADVVHLAHMLDVLEVREGLEPGSIRIMPVATETAAAMFSLHTYHNSSPRLIGLTWGAEDIAADVGATTNRRPDGIYDDLYRMARTFCLLGAAAAKVAAIDTVWVNFREIEGLRAEAESARRMGFSGKIAIHPDQVPIINDAFTPSEAEIAYAQRVIEIFSGAGSGTASLDGKMLDMPHLKQAQKILKACSR